MPNKPYIYRQNELEYFKKRVALNQSTLVVSLPGFGCSALFRELQEHLATPETKTVLVDLNLLHKFTTQDFFDYLGECLNLGIGSKDNIMEYLLNSEKDTQQVVFIIDRFEKACQMLPVDIFDALRAVTHMSKRKVTFIFGVDREITDLRTIEEMDQFYTLINLFTYYLKPLNKEDSLNFINGLSELYGINLNEKLALEIYQLTGGHLRLLKTFMVLISNEEKSKITTDIITQVSKDQSVTYQCDRIYKHLSELNKETLLRIINKLEITPSDKVKVEKLKQLGILDDRNKVFSPLFLSYISSLSDSKDKSLFLDEKTGEIYQNGERIDSNLSANEYKLLKHFYNNAFQILDRNNIAESVWGASTNEGVSDEAIDQLISRLREKIEVDRANPKHIFTYRGRGFQFKP